MICEELNRACKQRGGISVIVRLACFWYKGRYMRQSLWVAALRDGAHAASVPLMARFLWIQPLPRRAKISVEMICL